MDIDITYVTTDDLGGQVPFEDSRADRSGIERAKRAICEVRAFSSDDGPPRSRGTAVFVCGTGRGGGYFATAAHVVCNDSGRGTQWPDIQLRLDSDDTWHRARVAHCGVRVDLALLETDSVPVGADAPPIPRTEKDTDGILAQGTRVLYAGYPLDPDSRGKCSLVVSQGMIGGCTVRVEPAERVVYPEYIIDGMFNSGMSGGPVFCPHTGVLAGIIRACVTPGMVEGHGWGYALPVDGVLYYLRSL